MGRANRRRGACRRWPVVVGRRRQDSRPGGKRRRFRPGETARVRRDGGQTRLVRGDLPEHPGAPEADAGDAPRVRPDGAGPAAGMDDADGFVGQFARGPRGPPGVARHRRARTRVPDGPLRGGHRVPPGTGLPHRPRPPHHRQGGAEVDDELGRRDRPAQRRTAVRASGPDRAGTRKTVRPLRGQHGRVR